MSFGAIRSIATSALMASQARIQVTSSNIANADVEGYSRKTAVQVATTAGGAGTGTSVVAVTSSVNKYLLSDLVGAATALGAATVTDAKADALQALFGTTTSSDGTGTSLSDTLTSLATAIGTLAGTPESSTLSGLAVDSLDAVAAQLRETSTGIQKLRADADGEIDDAVDTVNDALDTIAELNTQIVAAKAMGQSTADLEDQRNTALLSISSQIDVAYKVKSNGEMLISTGSGTTLLNGAVHHLNYTPAAAVTADTTFSGITVDGTDITGQLSSGKIGALIAERDGVLPAAQDMLDTLAASLIDALNTAHNAATALPAPSTLSGTTAVSAGDALDASGTLRVALANTDGTTLSATDLDLSGITTVGDLVDALNGISGISASVASGKLVISSTDGSGVAIGDVDSAIGGKGVSDYFGLNDLLTGSDASTIRVRSDILSGATALATATLDTSSTLSAGSRALTNSSTTVQALADLLTGDRSFAAAGGLGATSGSFAGYAARIVSAVATDASSAASALERRQSTYDAASDALTSETGVNVDEETARLSELEQQYSTAAQLLSVLNDMFDALLAAAKS
jgi:flagellar hook-associated protein 1 FlgK